jgi:RNA polymerase sigma factor (sigma-70 family)
MTARTAALRRVIHSAAPEAEPVADGELLRRFARDNDQAAFATVVRRHTPLVLGVCRRVLPTAQDAEDACQATFLVLARKAASVGWRPSVAGWLYAVARKVAGNARVAARRRARREAAAAAPDVVMPVDRMTGRELLAALDAELDQLPPRYRDPLVLCFLQGLTRDEAAVHLGVPLGTLHTRIDRGRKKLATALTRRGMTLGAGLLACATASRVGATPSRLVNGILAAVRGNVSKGVADLSRGVVTNGAGTKAVLLMVAMLGAAILGVGAMSPPADGPKSDKAMPARADQPAAKGELKPAGDEKGEPVEVSGRVVDPDGKPVAGATVAVWTRATRRDRTTSGSDGRFRIGVRPTEGPSTLITTAEGFGPDWHDLPQPVPTGHEVTLRLAKDDVPISGRLLDLEGRGVAGATVRVRRVEKRADGGDLDEVVATKQKWARGNYVNGPDLVALRLEALPGPAAVTTDTEGRFRLTGLGRERVVSLTIEGKAIEPINVEVFTRTGPVTGLYSGNENEAVYAATFERVIPPGKPVTGTVREKRTGKPLAGIRVTCGRCSARTDADGRYRIDGPRKQSAYTVTAYAVPYFDVTKSNVADTPGFEPVVLDFELERGIEIRGAVLDKVTGKPVAGTVTYLAFADNPNLKRFSGLGPGGNVREDGSFSFTAIPGPGVLAVLADEDNYVKHRPGADWKLTPTINWAPGVAHAFVRIDATEGNPKSAIADIRLEPAGTVGAEIVGPDGKLVRGYYAAGLTASARQNVGWMTQRDAPAVTVRGLDGSRPRTVVVLSADKKFGAARPVRADEKGPIQMMLEPLGGVSGRVVGADGRPRAGLPVRATFSRGGEDGDRLPVQFFITQSTWAASLEPKAETDADGKFRLTGLMPGLKYALVVGDEDGEVFRREGLSPAAGKVEDLGDVKGK